MRAHPLRWTTAVLTAVLSAPASAQPGSVPAPPAAAPPAAPSPAQPTTAPGYPPYPGYPAYPPPGYAYPPGYPAYPPGYVYPPAREQAPKQLPYQEGQQIPQGYYLDEGIRRGPVIAGTIVFGVPYVLGFSIAAGLNFESSTGWLALPVAGPWLTLATREDSCDETDPFDSGCEDDRAIRTLLVLDGLMQGVGAILSVWGLTSPRKRLLRNDVSTIVVSPRRVGAGFGFGVAGSWQ
jgi:hypothetical protein